jgi:ABC-type polysaccharide/polyol phosphate transport system ATPase subunit
VKERKTMGSAAKQKKLKRLLSPLKEQADGFVMNVEGAVTENFRLADQKYFEEHPTQTVDVRPPFPSEFSELPRLKKVQVRQIAEGMRARIPIE